MFYWTCFDIYSFLLFGDAWRCLWNFLNMKSRTRKEPRSIKSMENQYQNRPPKFVDLKSRKNEPWSAHGSKITLCPTAIQIIPQKRQYMTLGQKLFFCSISCFYPTKIAPFSTIPEDPGSFRWGLSSGNIKTRLKAIFKTILHASSALQVGFVCQYLLVFSKRLPIKI